MKKQLAKKGDKVKVYYTGRLDNGRVFDHTESEKPLEFTVGSRNILSGFDKAVEGMKLFEEKMVVINSENAFGNRNDNLIREFPKKALSKNIKPKKGSIIRVQKPSGESTVGTILDTTKEGIVIDLNHPLAGKDLTFDIKIIDIE